MITESLDIRPAIIEDSEGITLLAQNLGFPSRSVDVKSRLRRILDHDDHQIYVAGEDGGLLIGFIHIYQSFLIETDPFAEIGALIVSSNHRRLGIGRLLFKRAEDWCRDRSLRTIRCRNHAADSDSFAFFNNMQFKQLLPQSVFVYHLPA